MSFIKYNRKELLDIISLIRDYEYFSPYHYYWSPDDKADGVKKLEDLREIEINCGNPDIDELELNRSLWRVFGPGITLHILVIVPFEHMPLLINTYKGTQQDIIVKIRFQIGK